MFHEQYFEDYELGAQRQTGGRTITETDIVIHAGQTGDFYPHHMDAEWCKTQDFGQRIAHGTLIFSVAVGMTADHRCGNPPPGCGARRPRFRLRTLDLQLPFRIR